MIKETIETALTQLSHQVLQEDAPETRKAVSILKAKDIIQMNKFWIVSRLLWQNLLIMH